MDKLCNSFYFYFTKKGRCHNTKPLKIWVYFLMKMWYNTTAGAGWADPGKVIKKNISAGIFHGNGDTGPGTWKLAACVLCVFYALLAHFAPYL